jgi:hypothetical protein
MMKQKLMILMVLVAGLAACTEDDGDTYNADINYNAITPILKGEFEGVWVVDQQEVDTARLTVTDSTFQFRLPEAYLLENANYVYEYAPLGERCDCPHKLVGFSDNIAYYDFVFYHQAWPGVAIYDINTGLWTLKITLESNEAPVILIYIAKRKI